MKEIAEFITGLFNGLKLPIRWIITSILIILIFFGFFKFEQFTSHFYILKLEKKIELLEKLKNVAENIDSFPELESIYSATVFELESLKIRPWQIEFPDIAEIYNRNDIYLWKAVSGGFIWLIILIIGVTSEVKKEKRMTGLTIVIAIVLSLIVLLFGWIGSIIPIVFNPWVNYLGFPILQLTLLVLISKNSNKKKQEN